MIKLGKKNRTIRVVGLRFSSSNRETISNALKEVDRKINPRQKNVSQAKKIALGTQLIPKTEKCDISQFVEKLEQAGYELVHFVHKPFCDHGTPLRHVEYFQLDVRPQHVAYFLFALKEFSAPSEAFKSEKEMIHTELLKMCRAALWQSEMFLNPFYQDGKQIAGHNSININFNARLPLNNQDGQPVMVWEKNVNGHRSGKKVPLEPNHVLVVSGNAIRLIKTTKALVA